MEKMRINKYLSKLGVGSRREIDRMLDDKRIEINGAIPEKGLKINEEDRIKVDGREVEVTKEKKVYYLLNKPKGVLTSVKDDRGRQTVIDILPKKERIYPIGRLDLNTTGLLIVTNDGELFNRIIHPRKMIGKTYKVEVKGRVTQEDKKNLEEGIVIDGRKTLEAKVEIKEVKDSRSVFLITIFEGRNRQIRKMCEKIEKPVINLHRMSLGKLEIKGVKKGEYRELTKKEVTYLYSI